MLMKFQFLIQMNRPYFSILCAHVIIISWVPFIKAYLFFSPHLILFSFSRTSTVQLRSTMAIELLGNIMNLSTFQRVVSLICMHLLLLDPNSNGLFGPINDLTGAK
uniref:Uncharacterized protein n=1 Tax=Cacopsylla melanoneura TaxID=428564 RepID=A0A8D8R7Q2_9HEMI